MCTVSIHLCTVLYICVLYLYICVLYLYICVLSYIFVYCIYPFVYCLYIFVNCLIYLCTISIFLYIVSIYLCTVSIYLCTVSIFLCTVSQGTNARKDISEVYAFLYCSVLSLGGKVNTRQMSQPDIESIFTKIIYEIFWSWETVMWILKIIKIKSFLPPRILNEHWCIYSCLQSLPKENSFQYVRRVYEIAINLPCISTLLSLNI